MTEKQILFCKNYEANYDALYSMTLNNENIEDICQSGRDYHYCFYQLLLPFEMSIDEILKSSEFTDCEKLELISFAKEYWEKIQNKAHIAWIEYATLRHNDVVGIFGEIID